MGGTARAARAPRTGDPGVQSWARPSPFHPVPLQGSSRKSDAVIFRDGDVTVSPGQAGKPAREAHCLWEALCPTPHRRALPGGQRRPGRGGSLRHSPGPQSVLTALSPIRTRRGPDRRLPLRPARNCGAVSSPSLAGAQKPFLCDRKCPRSAQRRPSGQCPLLSRGVGGVLEWPAFQLAYSTPTASPPREHCLFGTAAGSPVVALGNPVPQRPGCPGDQAWMRQTHDTPGAGSW